jgi:segregation and condensation protein A
MPGTYTVNVGSYEGPFDLLLQLIAKRKVDIYEIPLAQITDDYLMVLRQMEHVDLEVTTEFLMVAATLLELKAARLLPGEDDPELEELALEARDLLYARLLDYRTFRDAATFVGMAIERHIGFVPRRVGPDEFAGLRPPPEIGLDAEAFAHLAARVFADQPATAVDLTHVQPVRMTVAEAADLVMSELARAGGTATFREVTAGCRHPIEVIVCFLALLELYKHEHVDLSQASNFGEMVVRAESDEQVAITERYEGAATAAEGEDQ